MHPIAVTRTMFANQVSPAACERIIGLIDQSTALMAVAQFRGLGGAVARVPADATAYAHRAWRMMINVAAIFTNPADAPAHEPWVKAMTAAVNPPDTSAYVKFIGAEDAARARDAYPPATWNRLRAVKRTYDPANVFRLNVNVPN